jgi:hypothetical protein
LFQRLLSGANDVPGLKRCQARLPGSGVAKARTIEDQDG